MVQYSTVQQYRGGDKVIDLHPTGKRNYSFKPMDLTGIANDMRGCNPSALSNPSP